jgi:uncharacterized membrane protein
LIIKSNLHGTKLALVFLAFVCYTRQIFSCSNILKIIQKPVVIAAAKLMYRILENTILMDDGNK